MYVNSKRASEYWNVTASTLRRWQENGTVETKVLPSGHRRYRLPERESVRATSQASGSGKFIYARVSSQKQKKEGDLQRQIQYLADQYPEHKIISDVGSGLNFKRAGFLSLLGYAMRGELSEVAVTSKDRLCRFAFELIQHIVELHGGKILVLDQRDKSPIDEVGEGQKRRWFPISSFAEGGWETTLYLRVLSIMQVFACRWNGKRKYRPNRQNRPQDQNLSDDGPKRETEKHSRLHTMVV